MRISKVYNVSLLSLIKQHEQGLTLEEIKEKETSFEFTPDILKKELEILLEMGEIRLTKDGKYV